MRASLRTAATLGLALCASLLPGAIGADNVDANGDPCTNSGARPAGCRRRPHH
jgi:hypothetical protein